MKLSNLTNGPQDPHKKNKDDSDKKVNPRVYQSLTQF